MVISPTILLCDDAEGFRVMLGTMLSAAGLDVSVACTWDDAVTRATERQPDAVIDALPESDSREPLIGRLRAEAARASERLSIYRHKTLLGSGDARSSPSASASRAPRVTG